MLLQEPVKPQMVAPVAAVPVYTPPAPPAPPPAPPAPAPPPVKMEIEVPVPPKFLQPLRDLSAEEGTRVVFEGLVQGECVTSVCDISL